MKNTYIFAESANRQPGFHIFLSFSGQREYLMTHRSNPFLFALLKDGLRVSELARMTPRRLLIACGYTPDGHRIKTEKLVGSFRHLQDVVADYLADRACPAICTGEAAPIQEYGELDPACAA